MAVYQALLLNTAVPQIQAAQAGDSYVMVVNATTPALRITQTGTGDAILVEDAANPDSSPFVVTAAGDVGMGISSPVYKLQVIGTSQLSLSAAGTQQALQLNNSDTTAGTQAVKLGFSSAGVTKASINAAVYGNDYMTFNVGSDAEKMRLDASGNLGLGVTPSASWTGGSVLQQGVGALYENSSLGTYDLTYNSVRTASNSYVYALSSLAATRFQQRDGAFNFFTAPSGTAGNAITFTQAMTLDASGNLAVGGTTNKVTGLSGSGNGLTVQGSASPTIGIYDTSDTSYVLSLGQIDSASYIWNGANGFMAFGTNNSERARITSSGEFLVGTANAISGFSSCKLTAVSSAGSYFQVTGGAAEFNYVHNTATTGDNGFLAFGTEASFATRGSITYNRAGGLVAYNTTSDYRAKDIIGPVANSGETIDALKVYSGKMKGATVERPMLIAHEAQAVTPYAVTGEKDAVNDDGTPKYQQMDVSSLVPLLIAEIQSLRARVAQLEAK